MLRPQEEAWDTMCVPIACRYLNLESYGTAVPILLLGIVCECVYVWVCVCVICACVRVNRHKLCVGVRIIMCVRVCVSVRVCLHANVNFYVHESIHVCMCV